METGEHQESAKEWAKRLREGELTGEDLYALVESVMVEQNTQNPITMPTNFSPDYWDPTAVDLRWDRYNISLTRAKSSNEDTYMAIDIQINGLGKGGSREDFQLRKYSDGQVKGFWFFPEPLDSILFGETLSDKPMEVELTPIRTRRIGQVMVSAHAVSMATS